MLHPRQARRYELRRPLYEQERTKELHEKMLYLACHDHRHSPLGRRLCSLRERDLVRLLTLDHLALRRFGISVGHLLHQSQEHEVRLSHLLE